MYLVRAREAFLGVALTTYASCIIHPSRKGYYLLALAPTDSVLLAVETKVTTLKADVGTLEAA